MLITREAPARNRPGLPQGTRPGEAACKSSTGIARRASSSAGRAPARRAGGRGIVSLLAHRVARRLLGCIRARWPGCQATTLRFATGTSPCGASATFLRALPAWARSSAGRAPPRHGGGRGIEARRVHHGPFVQLGRHRRRMPGITVQLREGPPCRSGLDGEAPAWYAGDAGFEPPDRLHAGVA